jgi:hypothetical protein
MRASGDGDHLFPSALPSGTACCSPSRRPAKPTTLGVYASLRCRPSSLWADFVVFVLIIGGAYRTVIVKYLVDALEIRSAAREREAARAPDIRVHHEGRRSAAHLVRGGRRHLPRTSRLPVALPGTIFVSRDQKP